MTAKRIRVVVSLDAIHFIEWALNNYSADLDIYKHTALPETSDLTGSSGAEVLIVGSHMLAVPLADALKAIAEANPALKILLIVPPTINKQEALQIIQEKLVRGMIVQPITAEILVSYMKQLNLSPGK